MNHANPSDIEQQPRIRMRKMTNLACCRLLGRARPACPFLRWMQAAPLSGSSWKETYLLQDVYKMWKLSQIVRWSVYRDPGLYYVAHFVM